MDDLIMFVRARLDEDARDAESAGDSWYGYNPEQQIAFVSEADARHIARHGPARVLREVAAKRCTLDLHSTRHTVIDGFCTEDGGPCTHRGEVECTLCGETGCTTTRLLALPYADHLDYREEWRP